MNIGDTYFQFPLCALAFAAEQKVRLDHIIAFGFVDAGFAMLRKLPYEISAAKAETFATLPGRPYEYRKTKPEHVAALLGAQEIGITVGSLTHSLAS